MKEELVKGNPEETLEDNLEISIHAISGSLSLNTMRFLGTIEGQFEL